MITKLMKFATALSFLALILAACDEAADQSENAAPPPPTVGVVPVMRTEILPAVEFVARVEAIDSVDLLARVGGFLEEQSFDDGDDVNADQELFQIEQAPYVAEINRLKAAIERARATRELASIERQRQATLVERNAVAQSLLDEATAREAEAQADVDQRLAELERAELDLAYTVVQAPMDGRIGRTNFSVGDFVGPQSGPLATLVKLDPVYVRVSVSDRLLLQLRREQVAANFRPLIRLSDGEMYEAAGRFVFADATVDPTTDTVAVRAEFANPNAVLLPDQFVTLVVQEAEASEALVVPQAAIQADQGGQFVMIVDSEGKAAQARVQLGSKEGLDWVVEGGLEEGQQVIVQGLQRIRPGIAVQTMDAEIAEG